MTSNHRYPRAVAGFALAMLLGLTGAPAARAALVSAPASGKLTYFTEPRPLNVSALFAPSPGSHLPPAQMLADSGGLAIAAIGDLPHARHVAVLVPGMGRNRANFGVQIDDGSGAERASDTGQMQRGGSLYSAMAQRAGHEVAVVVFLGYLPPQDEHPLTVLDDRMSKPGIPELAKLTGKIRAAAPHAHLSWICHSYGSLVCAGAAGELRQGDDLVFIGSPGTSKQKAAQLAPARVWAGEGRRDPIAFVGLAQALGLAPFGPQPTDLAFGARVFDAGGGGHSDYFRRGSRPVHALAQIATAQMAGGK